MADLEVAASLQGFAVNDGGLLRGRMLVAQVGGFAATWPPLSRGAGQLGVQGGGGGGDGGGRGLPQVSWPHRLLACVRGVALLQGGSENFAW